MYSQVFLFTAFDLQFFLMIFDEGCEPTTGYFECCGKWVGRRERVDEYGKE
jgi:hypothetical protein